VPPATLQERAADPTLGCGGVGAAGFALKSLPSSRSAVFVIINKRLRMSGSFEERRKNFEEKWAHDEELRFKVLARRDKLLGEWAGQELGLNGSALDAYAKSLAQAELKKSGETEILLKLRADFDAKKIAHSDHLIHRKMEEFLRLAGDQILHETKTGAGRT
jgi:hypothetical protein